jgi:hypothetical protein
MGLAKASAMPAVPTSSPSRGAHSVTSQPAGKISSKSVSPNHAPHRMSADVGEVPARVAMLSIVTAGAYRSRRIRDLAMGAPGAAGVANADLTFR